MYHADYKTSNYVESSLDSVDNSATPNLKHSQLHAMERDLSTSYDGRTSQTEGASDWLSCISRKTGLSRFLLALTLLVSAMTMIWLCVSTTVTAPDHKVQTPPQVRAILCLCYFS